MQKLGVGNIWVSFFVRCAISVWYPAVNFGEVGCLKEDYADEFIFMQAAMWSPS